MLLRRMSALCFVAGCASDIGLSSKTPEAVSTPTEIEIPGNDPEDPRDTSGPIDTDTAAPPVNEEPVPQPTAPVYAETSNTLYTVDPGTGEATVVGVFRENSVVVDEMVDIAIHTDGRLFGGTQGAGLDAEGRALYLIDPNDASVTKVCDVDVVMYALAFLPDGRLVAGGFETLYTIDPDDNCRTELLYQDSSYTTSGDLVTLPDGKLYWTVRGAGEEGDHLVVVDPSFRTPPLDVGVIGYDRLYGLGYDQAEDRLYGFSADGEIVEVNPTNAQTTVLSSGQLAWWGATTNPVIWN